MNELAKTILEDGQPQRAIHNYLSESFDGIKNKYISDYSKEFTDRIEFLKFIQSVIDVQVISLEAWKEDDEEGYSDSNNSSPEEIYKEIIRRELVK